jgi:hypothetical protein
MQPRDQRQRLRRQDLGELGTDRRRDLDARRKIQLGGTGCHG